MRACQADVEIRLVDAWNVEEIADLYRAGGWWKDTYRPGGLAPLLRGASPSPLPSTVGRPGLAGVGRVISDGVSDCYIQDLVVLPSYRRHGIGRKIVESRSWLGRGPGRRLGSVCRRAGLRQLLLRGSGLKSCQAMCPCFLEEGPLMLSLDDFRPVTLEDRACSRAHYALYPQTHSDNTFTNMVCWNHYAHYRYA